MRETVFRDHVTRYGCRPVYRMLSSPNATFQALIYMHRYTPETLTTVPPRYLRQFRDLREAYARLERVFENETISCVFDSSWISAVPPVRGS